MDAPREWLTHPSLASEVLEVLRRLKQKAPLEQALESRLAQLEQAREAIAASVEADVGVQFIGPPDPLDVSNLAVDELASLMLRATDFTTPEGAAAGSLEVLLQRGESRKLLGAVDRALSSYAPNPPRRIAGGVLLDAFPDRAARYVLAIAEHERKSDKEPQVETAELLAVWDQLEPVAMAVDVGGIDEGSREDLTKALNHPAGKLAQALFAMLLPKSVRYRSPLDERLKARVERHVSLSGGAARAFLAIAASRLYLLHFADPEWCSGKLIPCFDWRKDEAQARASWQGYLWAPQLDQHLYAQLRGSFLDTFERSEHLGGLGESLCGLLVSLALDGGDTLAKGDTRRAIGGMSDDMRSTVVWLLGKRLEEAETGAAELARSRVLPWLRDWPAESKLWSDDRLADRFTSIAIRCGEAFSDAVDLLVERPLKLGKWQFAIHRLLDQQTHLFPDHAVDIARLFDHLLPTREENLRLGSQVWAPRELQQLVDKLRAAGEPVTSSPEFKRLEARL